MDEIALREAIAQAQAGRGEGFDALLDDYGPRLWAMFLRGTGDRHEADELLSEISLRLVRTIGRYRHSGRFEPWLFRIAANLLRDRRRRLIRRPAEVSLSGEDDDDGDGGTAIDPAENEPGPVEQVVARERAAQLEEALARLGEPTRLVLLMRYFGQMSFKEIAEALDCPMGTVLARSQRGLAALREMLSND